MKCEKNNIIVFLLNRLDFSTYTAIPINSRNHTAHTVFIGSYITDNRCYLWLYSVIVKKKLFSAHSEYTARDVSVFTRLIIFIILL